jgi:hypothetical protein
MNEKKKDARHCHQLPSFLRVWTSQANTSYKARLFENLIKQLYGETLKACVRTTTLVLRDEF